jgi:ATPase components of ABC transporters with duplicated ATPase domains
MRDALDQTITLKEALSPIGDTVTFRGRPMHVASWAKRFLFRPEQLPMQVSYLSGGEQARIFIARLMLQEADLLILDEPTNDLDIPTLEVLEESLDEFPGAVVLVTHDRFMLDSISTHLLTLDGAGGARYFADYLQWQDVEGKEAKQAAKDNKVLARESRTSNGDANSLGSRDPKDRSHLPLSNNEKKELAGIEAKILAAEEKVAQIKERMLDRAIASNHVKLAELSSEAEKAQADVDKIYARYGELEARSKF